MFFKLTTLARARAAPWGTGGPWACPGRKGSGRCEQAAVDAEARPLCSLPGSRGPRGRGAEASTPAGSHRWPAGRCWLGKRHLGIQGPTGGSSPDTATVRGWPRASPRLPPCGVQGRHGPFPSHNEPKMLARTRGGKSLAHLTGALTALYFSLGLSPSVQPPAATRWQCWTHPASPAEAPGQLPHTPDSLTQPFPAPGGLSLRPG